MRPTGGPAAAWLGPILKIHRTENRQVQCSENLQKGCCTNSLKTTLDQALRLRGSRSFDTRPDYEAFVDTIVQRMNTRALKFLVTERTMLKPLPVRRTAEFDEIPARVSKYAVFTLKGALYSVPSQLIGHRLMVRQYAQHVEGWLGGQCVVSLPRARPAEGQRVGRSIDYRHLVGALKRKPGAFARWVLRDASFPRAVYRQTWERLAAQRPEREACKTMVGLLVLASEGHEAQLAQELEQLIELGQLPDLNALTQLLAPPKGDVPQVVVTLPTLASYDELFEATL